MRALFSVVAAIVLIGPITCVSAADTNSSPYAGQQMRTIKALSADDIAALRDGDGIGMAKAAELNGYPGPRHVLALARELQLTTATTAIGDVQGRLRAVHLAAHLETRALLSPEQIAQYEKLRGYADAGNPNHDHPAVHRH